LVELEASAVQKLAADTIDFSTRFKYTDRGGVVVSRLALHLLGPPRIELDGVPIDADRRKAIALLAYIAVTAQSHPRTSLINLLWPELDPSGGRAALRRALYSLNKALAGDWLDIDRDRVGLSRGKATWLDVDQFRRHLAESKAHQHPADQVCAACVTPLTEAVALYRGDFLAGFGLRDSLNFDDWQFFQADALRRGLAGALEGLVDWHTGQRDFAAAIGYGKRLLALDPLDEQVHGQLMRTYAWSGQRSAALQQYNECARILQNQLGVPPVEDITDLYRAIKEGRVPPAPPAPPVLTAPTPQFEQWEPTERPLFVARESELARMDRFLDASLDSQGRVIFVTGDAGSGKTALIQAFAQQAQKKHPQLIVAWGHCNAHTGAGDPYLPFRELLGLLTGDVETWWAAKTMTGEQARRLWRLVPIAAQMLVKAGPDLVDLLVPGDPLVERARSFAPLRSGAVWLTQLERLVARRAAAPQNSSLQQNALFEQCSQVLRGLARQTPLLLALDDLQWADAGSLNLLFHLGRQLEGSRILLVGAYRPVEVGLGRPAEPPCGEAATERERHPLEPLVHEFKRLYGDIEIDLEQAAGRQFIDAYLDSESNSLGESFRHALYQRTSGFPLFTVELLRGMQERGDLVQDSRGRWVEGRTLDWETLPARVEAVITGRIARLPSSLRDTLAIASVEGETFTAEVVARVTGADAVETVRCLSEMLGRRHRLVSAQGAQTIRTTHPPLGSVGDLSRYRFQHILFQKHLYNSLDSVERAHLHRAVGTALESLYAAGAEEDSPTIADPVQLALHFQRAGIVGKAITYLRQAGEKAQRFYANDEAADHYRQALDLLKDDSLLEPAVDELQETIAAIREKLGDVLEWAVEHDEAQMAYRRALDSIPRDDVIWQARLHRKLGNLWRTKRQYQDALQAYDQATAALGTASEDSTPQWWQEWVQIQLERMWLHYWLGEWPEISELAGPVRSIVERHGTPSQCISFFLSLTSMNNRRDQYIASAENLSFCQTALAIALDSDNLSEIAWARFMLGFNQLWASDLDLAEKQLQTALALAERTGDIVHQSRCLTYLTILHRKREQLEQAHQYVSQSLAAATEGQMREYVGTASANLSWLAWREGDLVEAEDKAQAALDIWRRLPAGHSSCAFQWTALWPLVGVAFSGNRYAQACEFLRQMLGVTQQRLPDALEALVEQTLEAWEEPQSEETQAYLEQAIELAKRLGYL
jgi:DNA-binding SARP family transcriptional activator